MKKVIYILLASIFMIIGIQVKALENKLYFTSNGDRLYYKTELYNEDIFMKHTDMVPGKTYKDELVIENGTQYTYKLYMKVKERSQSSKADELLDNINMKIYLDGEILYEGASRGLDYKSSGVNLQEAIYIGEYKENKTSKIEVETELDKSYEDITNKDLSYIDWEFYAEYDDLLLPINPDTGINTNKYMYIVIISLSIALILILSYIFLVEKRKIRIKMI